MKRFIYAQVVAILIIVGCGRGSPPAGHVDQKTSTPEATKVPSAVVQPETQSGTVGPAPVFTLEDMQRESGKEPFEGEFGGILFKRTVSAEDLGCPAATPVDEVLVSTVSSPLVVGVDFLKPDFSVTGGDRVAICGNRAISYAVRALGGTGFQFRELSIARFSGETVVSSAPLEALHKAVVGRKPAVLIQGIPLPGAPRGQDPYRWGLVLKEDFGVTVVEARGLTRDELLKVAEKLP